MDKQTQSTQPMVMNNNPMTLKRAVLILVIIILVVAGYFVYKKLRANYLAQQAYEQKVATMKSLSDYATAHPVSAQDKEAAISAFLKTTSTSTTPKSTSTLPTSGSSTSTKIIKK